METFLYREINRANREKDVSKVENLGPISCALFLITNPGQHKQFKCYRGVKLS